MPADSVVTRFLKDKVSGPPSGAGSDVLKLWPEYIICGNDMMSVMTASSSSVEGQSFNSIKTGDARENCLAYQTAIDELMGTSTADTGSRFYYPSRMSRT